MTSSQVSQPISGYVDVYDDFLFSGWSWNPNAPTQNIALTINNEFVRTYPALLLRKDVQLAGIGNGICGFHFTLSASLFERGTYLISIEEGLHRARLERGLLLMSNGNVSPIGRDTPVEDILQRCTPLSIQAFCDTYYKYQECLLHNSVEMIMDKLSHLPPREFLAYSYCIIIGKMPDSVGYSTNLAALISRKLSYRDFIRGQIASDEFSEESNIKFLEERIDKLVLPAMFSNKFDAAKP